MPQYRVTTLEETKADKEPVVELRFTSDENQPAIEGRNPGGEWQEILFFGKSGGVGLLLIESAIEGLEVDRDGQIEIF